jgi:hypothetical protein
MPHAAGKTSGPVLPKQSLYRMRAGRLLPGELF